MSNKNFTRNRKLPFPKMILIMMKKGVKSIQNTLNETQIYLSALLEEDLKTISKSAYTKAREKLNYTAFIELYSDTRDMFYKYYDYKTYKGFRTLAIDGSITNLPFEEDIKKEFSEVNVSNQYKDKDKQIIQARVSTLYDVLNNIAIDAIITDKSNHEIALSENNHFKHLSKNDLVLFDRGYPSFYMFALITHKHNANYLVRTKRNIYKEHTQALFNKDSNIEDITVILKPSTKDLKQKLIQNKLPLEIKVRFIRVVLDDGEIEVLATSVLDKDILQTSDFKELYFKRWGIETYYALLKERLTLENFTGKSALSIKQDFYSTILVSNIEAIAVYELNEELTVNTDNQNIAKNKSTTQTEDSKDSNKKTSKKTNKYIYKVNKSVSLNVIKNYCFDMFYSDKNMEYIINDMKKLMIKDKIPIRDNRHFSRNKNDSKNTRGIKSSQYHKRRKKVVF